MAGLVAGQGLISLQDQWRPVPRELTPSPRSPEMAPAPTELGAQPPPTVAVAVPGPCHGGRNRGRGCSHPAPPHGYGARVTSAVASPASTVQLGSCSWGSRRGPHPPLASSVERPFLPWRSRSCPGCLPATAAPALAPLQLQPPLWAGCGELRLRAGLGAGVHRGRHTAAGGTLLPCQPLPWPLPPGCAPRLSATALLPPQQLWREARPISQRQLQTSHFLQKPLPPAPASPPHPTETEAAPGMALHSRHASFPSWAAVLRLRTGPTQG